MIKRDLDFSFQGIVEIDKFHVYVSGAQQVNHEAMFKLNEYDYARRKYLMTNITEPSFYVSPWVRQDMLLN